MKTSKENYTRHYLCTERVSYNNTISKIEYRCTKKSLVKRILIKKMQRFKYRQLRNNKKEQKFKFDRLKLK